MIFKNGVSPVITNVLLVSIVIVLAGIVFLWTRSFVDESIEKNGRPIERVCDEVEFRANIVRNQNYFLEVNNRENIPLYGFKIKILGRGDVRVSEILENSIDVGQSARVDLSEMSNEIGSGTELLIVPVLLGKKGQENIPKECPDEKGVVVSVP